MGTRLHHTSNSSCVSVLLTSADPVSTTEASFSTQLIESIMMYCTWTKKVKSSIEIVFIYVRHDRHALISHLLIGAKDNNKESGSISNMRSSRRHDGIHATDRVYAVPTFESCHFAAFSSGTVPRIDADIVSAADKAPVKARCTPDEKKGSMKAAKDDEFR